MLDLVAISDREKGFRLNWCQLGRYSRDLSADPTTLVTLQKDQEGRF